MKTFKLIITLVAFSTLSLFGCKNEQANKNNTELAKEVKTTNQEEFNVGDAKDSKKDKSSADKQSNQATIVVKAKKALEYKFKINKYDKLAYEWKADGPLHYDFHGDPDAKNDYPQGHFESYAIGDSDHAKGLVTIPYKGSHGWYWKNTSNKDITITLTTKGSYNIIGLIQ